MPSLSTQERLQPSLLDRLTDHAPQSPSEPLQERVLSKTQLREAVLRDLSWLLNAIAQEPDPRSADRALVVLWRGMRAARESVLNFGIPALSGHSLSALEFPLIEALLRQAIVRFEPRIDPKTLSVQITNDLAARLRPTSLRLTIKGHLWNQPVPLELLLSADVDVDTGQAAVKDLKR